MTVSVWTRLTITTTTTTTTIIIIIKICSAHISCWVLKARKQKKHEYKEKDYVPRYMYNSITNNTSSLKNYDIR